MRALLDSRRALSLGEYLSVGGPANIIKHELSSLTEVSKCMTVSYTFLLFSTEHSRSLISFLVTSCA